MLKFDTYRKQVEPKMTMKSLSGNLAKKVPKASTFKYVSTVPRAIMDSFCNDSKGNNAKGYTFMMNGAMYTMDPMATECRRNKSGGGMQLYANFDQMGKALRFTVMCGKKKGQSCNAFVVENAKKDPKAEFIDAVEGARRSLSQYSANPGDYCGTGQCHDLGVDPNVRCSYPQKCALVYDKECGVLGAGAYRCCSDDAVCTSSLQCCGDKLCTGNGKGQSFCGCFPGDAMVTTPSGAKKMSSLKVGDKVLTATPQGDIVFEDVYMFGHKDPKAVVNFVRIHTSHNATLRLTPDHFVPVIAAKGGDRLREIPASKITLGDTILVQVTDKMHGVGKQSLRESKVTGVELIADQGLFNPYTMNGNIVVDNVVASCHSSSFLDLTMNMLGIHIPRGYQAVFAPIRATYRLLGAKNFRGIEYVIDRVADFINGDAPDVSGSSMLAAVVSHQSL